MEILCNVLAHKKHQFYYLLVDKLENSLRDFVPVHWADITALSKLEICVFLGLLLNQISVCSQHSFRLHSSFNWGCEWIRHGWKQIRPHLYDPHHKLLQEKCDWWKSWGGACGQRGGVSQCVSVFISERIWLCKNKPDGRFNLVTDSCLPGVHTQLPCLHHQGTKWSLLTVIKCNHELLRRQHLPTFTWLSLKDVGSPAMCVCSLYTLHQEEWTSVLLCWGPVRHV